MLSSLLAGQSAVAGDRVFVRGSEEGRGVLRERNGECFVITPEHVVDSSARIRVIDEKRHEVSARFEASYAPDLTVLRLAAGPVSCSFLWDKGRGLSARLAKATVAVVLAQGATGATERFYMRVVSHSDRTVTIRPQSGDDRLRQGLSGSMVEIAGRPAGMLMQVDAETGEGLVFRQDYVTSVMAPFFAVKAGKKVARAEGFHVEQKRFSALVTKGTAIRAGPSVLARSIRQLRVGVVVNVTGRVTGRNWYRIDGGAEEGGFVPSDAVQPL